MKTPAYQNPSGKDWRRGFALLSIYILIISLTAFWLLPDWWFLWSIIVIAGLAWLTIWHTNRYAYQCLHCNQIFEISVWKNLISPHGIDSQGGWTLLKCPHCGRWSQARILKIVVEDNGSDQNK